MGIVLQEKKYPTVYDSNGDVLALLSEVISLNEEIRLGDMSQLSFSYPIDWVDQFGIVKYDTNGNAIVNPKCQHLINDNRILFNNRWYIIKVVENKRDDSNRKIIECVCFEIVYLLQEEMIEYLKIIPPISNAMNATNSLTTALMAMQTERENLVVSASGTSVVLDANAHMTDNIYNNWYIYIKSGTGIGQTRRITSYNGTTKTVVVDTAFSPQVDSTSVYVIYNKSWSAGTVDSAFNIVARSHEFDFVNGWEALQQIRDKYLDENDNVGYLTFSSSWDIATSRWVNIVNLVKANPYNSIEIRYRKNLKSITRRIESDKLYTRVIPQGIDNLTVGSIATENRTDSSVTYPTHQLYYNYIDNFKYFMAQGYSYKKCTDEFVKVYRFEDSRYTNATTLYNDCKKLLEKASVPKITYVVSALDLSKMTGRSYEEFKEGDTIRVIDEDLNIDIYATIAYINRDWETPQNASIELTNFVDNVADVMKRIINRNDKYSNLSSTYGNTATYIIADRLTSKNWRQADYVIQPFEIANVVIQSITDSIDESKGAKVVLLDGIYNMYGALSLKSNVEFQGQGNATKLVNVLSQSNIININNKQNISINNVNFTTPDGSSASIYDMVVVSNNSKNIKIFNNFINEANGGILLSTNSNGVQFYNNYITNNVNTLSYCCYISESLNVDVYANVGNGKILSSVNFDISSSDVGTMNIYGNSFKINVQTYLFGFLSARVNGTVGTSGKIKIYSNSFLNTYTGNAYPSIFVFNVDVAEVYDNSIEGTFIEGINIASNKNTVSNNTINIKGTNGANTTVKGILINSGSVANDVQKNTIRNDTIYGSSVAPTLYLGIQDDGTNTIVASNSAYNYGVNGIVGTGVGRVVFGGNRT